MFLLTLIPISGASANLITNGGFETLGAYIGTGLYDAPGWTIADPSSATGIYSTVASAGYGSMGLTPAEGNSFLWGGGYLGNTGIITQQAVATTNAQQYNLSFSLANTNQGATATNFWYVTWDGTTLLSGTNVGDFANVLYTYTVTGTGNDLLSFGFNNEPGAFALDEVSLTAVPEPSTLLLLGAGLAGFAFFRKRAKTKV